MANSEINNMWSGAWTSGSDGNTWTSNTNGVDGQDGDSVFISTGERIAVAGQNGANGADGTSTYSESGFTYSQNGNSNSDTGNACSRASILWTGPSTHFELDPTKNDELHMKSERMLNVASSQALILKRGGRDIGENLVIDFDIKVSNPNLQSAISIAKDRDTLALTISPNERYDRSECVVVRTTVTVPDKVFSFLVNADVASITADSSLRASIRSLSLTSRTGKIVLDGCAVRGDTFSLESGAGAISFQNTNIHTTQDVHIKTGAGSVVMNGAKTHSPKVTLRSLSGAIDLRGSRIMSEDLLIDARAGSISAPRSEIKSWRTRCSSGTGAISGSFTLMDDLTIKSETGLIDVDLGLTPDSERYRPTDLRVPNVAMTTGAGSIKVRVSGERYRHFKGLFKSRAGRVHVDLPDSYRGTVLAETGVGRPKIESGSTMVVDRQHTITGGSERGTRGTGSDVRAISSVGDAVVRLGATSGSQ